MALDNPLDQILWSDIVDHVDEKAEVGLPVMPFGDSGVLDDRCQWWRLEKRTEGGGCTRLISVGADLVEVTWFKDGTEGARTVYLSP